MLSPSSCGCQATDPAARPVGGMAQRPCTRPPWLAAAHKHEETCPSTGPPELAQVEAGTVFGRWRPRRAAAAWHAAPSSQGHGSSVTACQAAAGWLGRHHELGDLVTPRLNFGGGGVPDPPPPGESDKIGGRKRGASGSPPRHGLA
jgi:hypothetical protein